jgi:hypothetical protein
MRRKSGAGLQSCVRRAKAPRHIGALRHVLTVVIAIVPAIAIAFAQQSLPLGPNRNAGEAITGAFEGWFYRPDGSISLLVGYFNRNLEQTVDIPIGPNNRIEPGGPDYGQPTHFLPRRQWGVFTIPVPKDFGDKKLAWTIVANGQTTTIPLSLHQNYQVEPYEEKGMGNTPPMLRFEPNGPIQTGPPNGIAASLTTTLPDPLPLTVWVTDKPAKFTANVTRPPAGGGGGGARGRAARPDLALTWTLHRGPADVKFDKAKPAIDKAADGKATTMATFTAPGEYILRAQANDVSGDGGGGFQCCWTNAHVKVTVKAAGTR